MGNEDTGSDMSMGDFDFNAQATAGQPEAQLSQNEWGFLKDVPEADKPVVARYLKGINGEVTKRFQGIHDQYKGWKDLGVQPEQARAALDFYQFANDDPVGFYQNIMNFIRQNPEAAKNIGFTDDMLEGGQQQQQIEEQEDPWEAAGLTGYGERFDQMEKALNVIAEIMQGQMTQSQEEVEDQELDALLEQLRSDHGDFDEGFVLSRIWGGMDPNEAVKAWFDTIETHVNSARSRPNLTLLGGTGGTPSNRVDPRQMTGEQKAELFASMLQADVDQGR